jgi:hypothetical protein
MPVPSDIYQDPAFKELSQQKCVEKIWDEKDDHTVANLTTSLCDYFCFQMGNSYWSDEDQWDYKQVQEIIKRLRGNTEVSLPSVEDIAEFIFLR